MSVTIQDMQPENFALFLAGDVAEVSDASAANAEEKLVVQKDRWYQLGVKNTAGGRAGLSSVSDLKFKAGGAAKPANAAGYNGAAIDGSAAGPGIVLDAERGRIYSKGMVGNVWLHYTVPAAKRMRASAGEARQIKAAVRYIEDSAGTDKGSNWYIRQATVGPAGEMALKDRSTLQSIGLQILVEVPAIAGEDGHPAILVNGAPYT